MTRKSAFRVVVMSGEGGEVVVLMEEAAGVEAEDRWDIRARHSIAA